MNNLNIFVSSTYYDLSQVRANLFDFIQSLGHTPFLSEFDSFPITPGNNTIENCIDNVRNHADLMILIIGNRYGYQTDKGKSITNTEFETAKSKGIPVYVFIEKSIINLLPVWKQNKNLNLENIVDSPKLFEFVDNIRNQDKLWTFEFSLSQEITDTLKKQLSSLFKESLKLRSKFQHEIDPDLAQNLTNDAIRTIIEKNSFFELDFFFQVLVDELNKIKSTKNDYHYQIFLESRLRISDDDTLLEWLQDKLSESTKLIESLTNLINDVFPVYFAEPGIPSDLKGLYYVAERYAQILKKFIEWSTTTIGTNVSENRNQLKNRFAKITNKLIEDTWVFPFEWRKKIDDLIEEKNLSGRVPKQLNIVLNLEIDPLHLDEYNKEFARFQESFGEDDFY